VSEDSPEARRFCRGLDFKSRRRLNDEEAGIISREAVIWKRKGIVIIVGYFILCPASFYGLSLVLGPIRDRFGEYTAEIIMGLYCLYGVLGGAAIAIHQGREKYALGETLARGVSDGAVDIFESPADALQKRSIEVLSAPDMLFIVDGMRTKRWMRAGVSDLAPDAHERFSVPIPAELLRNPAAQGLRHRHITPEERAEIAKHISSTFTPKTKHVFLLAVMGVIFYSLISDALVSTKPLMTAQWLMIVAGVLMFTVLGVLLARLWRIGLRLRKDLRNGRIITAPEHPLQWEFLPFSKRVWSVRGFPAPWRTRSLTRKDRFLRA
jgi:hypothetical protein